MLILITPKCSNCWCLILGATGPWNHQTEIDGRSVWFNQQECINQGTSKLFSRAMIFAFKRKPTNQPETSGDACPLRKYPNLVVGYRWLQSPIIHHNEPPSTIIIGRQLSIVNHDGQLPSRSTKQYHPISWPRSTKQYQVTKINQHYISSNSTTNVNPPISTIRALS